MISGDILFQRAANIATCVGVIGVFVAFRQLKSSREVQREATAIDVWKDFLHLALAHPDLAKPEPYMASQGSNYTKFSKYTWFVSAMLFAAERVLMLRDSDDWEVTIMGQLRLHSDYFHTRDFDPSQYGRSLRALIGRVLEEIPPSSALPPERLRPSI
jgi:hypothetical protein